jgi:hypothetical protein
LLDGFHAPEEIEDARGFERVKHLQTLFVILHNAGVPELGKVAGDGGDVHACGPGEVANTAGALGEFLDQEQAGGVGQGLEDGSLVFQALALGDEHKHQ